MYQDHRSIDVVAIRGLLSRSRQKALVVNLCQIDLPSWIFIRVQLHHTKNEYPQAYWPCRYARCLNRMVFEKVTDNMTVARQVPARTVISRRGISNMVPPKVRSSCPELINCITDHSLQIASPAVSTSLIFDAHI